MFQCPTSKHFEFRAFQNSRRPHFFCVHPLLVLQLLLSLAFTRLSLHPASSVFLQLRRPGGRNPPGPVEVSRATLHQAQALRHVQVNTPRAISARSLVVLLLDL